MIDAGLGEAQINSVLSAMNIPNLAPKALKGYERQVGCAIEEVAIESCIKSVQLEKKETIKALQEENE